MRSSTTTRCCTRRQAGHTATASLPRASNLLATAPGRVSSGTACSTPAVRPGPDAENTTPPLRSAGPSPSPNPSSVRTVERAARPPDRHLDRPCSLPSGTQRLGCSLVQDPRVRERVENGSPGRLSRPGSFRSRVDVCFTSRSAFTSGAASTVGRSLWSPSRGGRPSSRPLLRAGTVHRARDSASTARTSREMSIETRWTSAPSRVAVQR